MDQNVELMLEPNDNIANGLLYILDDGTQIKSSQIHFDNEDPLVDLTSENIPFVKYATEENDSVEEAIEENSQDIKNIKIIGSPPPIKESNSKRSFINSLPFRMVPNSGIDFVSQFSRYVEANMNKVDLMNRTRLFKNLATDHIRPNFVEIDSDPSNSRDQSLTREEVLNMFKDSPLVCAPYNEENPNFYEKRRHVRKTDPTRPVYKKSSDTKIISYIDVDTDANTKGQNCFMCSKYIDKSVEKLYLFDREDQKIYRMSPQRRMSTQLKIICEECLDLNFKPRRMRSPNRSLDPDEFLVIRNNQQYVFKKLTNVEETTGNVASGNFANVTDAKAIIDKIELEILKQAGKDNEGKSDFVKLEIGADGETITKLIDDINSEFETKDVAIIDDSSDVEIIESEQDDPLSNLDEEDEQVKTFLGENRVLDENIETKCRFCELSFADVSEAVQHAPQHKHDTEDGPVFPCPLCDYGYSEFKWLRAHLLAVHKKIGTKEPSHSGEQEKAGTKEVVAVKAETELEVIKDEIIEKDASQKQNVTSSRESSPIARRTRSSVNKKSDNASISKEPSEINEKCEKKEEQTEDKVQPKEENTTENVPEVKVEVEDMNEDEEAIWIVQAADDDTELNEEQWHKLLTTAKLQSCDRKTKYEGGSLQHHECHVCRKIFISPEALNAHKCVKRRGRKRKSYAGDVLKVPTEADFMKRAEGKKVYDGANDENNLLVRPRRKTKHGDPTSDPQVVTCNECKESFTSKVRLKFHMQFHEQGYQIAEGRYRCSVCNEGNTFATETELFDHVHFQHGKQKRWQCPVEGCSKTFFLRATLTKHSRIHTDTRRYVCTTCGKRFLDKQTLDEHNVTHLQIKPYQCHICLKHLTRRSRLRMHLRAHEEELAPRLVLVCGVCDRAFKDHVDAQEHGTTSKECIEIRANELKEESGLSDGSKLELSPTSGLMKERYKNEDADAKSSFHRKTLRRMYEPTNIAQAEELLKTIADEAKPLIRVVEIEKAFRCEYCEDVFYVEDALNGHRLIHRGIKNPFTCHICKVSFPTYARCTTHKTTHGFYKRSLADVKKSGIGETSGDTEVRREEGGPSAAGIVGYGGFPVAKHFLCEDCGRSYLHWTYLQVHRRMKHATDNFLYKCNQCNMTFPNSWSLAYHKKKIHGKISQGDSGVCTNRMMNKEIVSARMPCQDCDEIFANRSALYKHRRDKHCDVPLRLSSKHGIFSCAECGKRYASKPGLQAHLRTHGTMTAQESAGGGQCSCAKCGDRFHTTTALLNHVKESHTRELQSWCAWCGKRFASRAELTAHARTHSARRSHACAICGRGFRTASTRDEHLRTHTGERPFPCDICGVAFRRLTAMKNHRLIHTGERPLPCPHCAKRFRTRSDLRTHTRLKHPQEIIMIEIEETNPEPQRVLQLLAHNKISADHVVDMCIVRVSKETDMKELSIEEVENLIQRQHEDEVAEAWSRRVMEVLAPNAGPERSLAGYGLAAPGDHEIAEAARQEITIAIPDETDAVMHQVLPEYNIYMELNDSTSPKIEHLM